MVAGGLAVGILAAGALVGAPAEAAQLYNEKIVGLSVNGGHSVAVGATGTVPIHVEVDVYDDSGIDPYGIRGRLAVPRESGAASADVSLIGAHSTEGFLDCSVASQTLTHCTGDGTLNTAELSNGAPGYACVKLEGHADDGDMFWLSSCVDATVDGRVPLQQRVLVTGAAASAHSEAKGAALAVRARLLHPDWDQRDSTGLAHYTGYAGQHVDLQFARAGTTVYQTVASAVSDANGYLQATVHVGYSGNWRYRFAGGTFATAFTSSPVAVTMLRPTHLWVDAGPEPSLRGRPLTVTGQLTRAVTEDAKSFAGYGGQRVALQFRRTGTSTWTTVRTVTADTLGRLRTTLTAQTSGTWRWVFAGNATNAPSAAAGDYVSVH